MKNCKAFLSGMAAMLLIMVLIGPAFASTGKIQKELEYRDIKVALDGQVLDLKDAAGNPVEPFMFDGTNYLPVRALAEALGLSVSWDGSTNTVKLARPGNTASPAPAVAPNEPVAAPAAPATPAAPPVTPAPAPATPAAPKPDSNESAARTIYITKTGKRYHYDSSCNGGTYIPSSLSDALARGLTPCNKCVG